MAPRGLALPGCSVVPSVGVGAGKSVQRESAQAVLRRALFGCSLNLILEAVGTSSDFWAAEQ